MATDSVERVRLAEAMDDRRAELRLNWEQVAARGRISVALLRRIRTTDHPITKDSELAIERALEWQRGSVRLILAGRQAVSLTQEPVPPEVMAAWEKYQERRVGGRSQEAALAMLRADLERIEEEDRAKRDAEKRRGRSA